jgi:RNA polymerase sigma-70 factor (ECF subfamily)
MSPSSKHLKMPGQENLIETRLIERLKQSDREAFSILFLTYYNDLVFFANNILRDINKAEEIVQDTFTKLWEEHESLIIKVSLKSYLLKAVQNKCLDWFRHMKTRQKYISEIMQENYFFEYDADNYLLKSELERRIEACIANLPDELKEVFCKNRYDGLTYNELAERLNVSVRTIEVRISKALQILRKELNDYLNL